jgi:hypothetical protein
MSFLVPLKRTLYRLSQKCFSDVKICNLPRGHVLCKKFLNHVNDPFALCFGDLVDLREMTSSVSKEFIRFALGTVNEIGKQQ